MVICQACYDRIWLIEPVAAILYTRLCSICAIEHGAPFRFIYNYAWEDALQVLEAQQFIKSYDVDENPWITVAFNDEGDFCICGAIHD